MAAIWNTGTSEIPKGGGAIALAYGEALSPGQYRDSPSGEYRLSFQGDGNLVLLRLPGTVLWNAGVLGGTITSMQLDGNLVVYDGAGTALWDSGTDGYPGAYLAIQNDGNLVLYSYGGLENFAVMSPQPTWQGGLTETLAWLTSASESPQMVEQRMGLRLSPRIMWEVAYTSWGPPRTFLDLLTMQAAGSPLFLPLWQDASRLTETAPGGKTLVVEDISYTHLADCHFAVLMGDDLWTNEVVEIFGRDATHLYLVGSLKAVWPAATKVYPAKKVKVESQLGGNRMADRAYVAKARFMSLEPNVCSAPPPLTRYKGFLVLEEDANDADSVSHQYDRKMFTLDTNVGVQKISDVAGFTHQSFSWWARGREAHWRLRGLFYALQGRRVPIWVSSNFADFDLVEPIAAGDTSIRVARCGFTDTGGPFKRRDHILIYLHDGTRLYREITAAAVGAEGTTEVLALDQPTGRDISLVEVHRISFLLLSRLDQDSVELVHHTDTHGLTTATSIFRTDPGIGPGPFRDEPPFQAWNAFAISQDGQHMVGVSAYDSRRLYDAGNLGPYNGSVWMSHDHGATWTQKEDAGYGLWVACSMSADGQTILASNAPTSANLEPYDQLKGILVLSLDGGESWKEITDVGMEHWIATAVSEDGMNMIVTANVYIVDSVTVNTTRTWTSNDGGRSWTQRADIVGRLFQTNIAISSTGQRALTGGHTSSGGIFARTVAVSNNFGASWSAHPPSYTLPGPSMAGRANVMTGDGQKLAVVQNESGLPNDHIVTSLNGGTTWVHVNDTFMHSGWHACASKDGSIAYLMSGYTGAPFFCEMQSSNDWFATLNGVNLMPPMGEMTGYGLACSYNGQELVFGRPNDGAIYVSWTGAASWRPPVYPIPAWW